MVRSLRFLTATFLVACMIAGVHATTVVVDDGSGGTYATVGDAYTAIRDQNGGTGRDDGEADMIEIVAASVVETAASLFDGGDDLTIKGHGATVAIVQSGMSVSPNNSADATYLFRNMTWVPTSDAHDTTPLNERFRENNRNIVVRYENMTFTSARADGTPQPPHRPGGTYAFRSIGGYWGDSGSPNSGHRLEFDNCHVGNLIAYHAGRVLSVNRSNMSLSLTSCSITMVTGGFIDYWKTNGPMSIERCRFRFMEGASKWPVIAIESADNQSIRLVDCAFDGLGGEVFAVRDGVSGNTLEATRCLFSDYSRPFQIADTSGFTADFTSCTFHTDHVSGGAHFVLSNTDGASTGNSLNFTDCVFSGQGATAGVVRADERGAAALSASVAFDHCAFATAGVDAMGTSWTSSFHVTTTATDCIVGDPDYANTSFPKDHAYAVRGAAFAAAASGGGALSGWGDYDPAAPDPAPYEFEAELAMSSGLTSRSDIDASGGYRMIQFNAEGKYLTYGDLPAGSCVLITYSLAAAAAKQCSVHVDGVDVATATFAPTGAWDAYRAIAVPVGIAKGSSLTLRLDADDQAANGGESCASQDRIAILDYVPTRPRVGLITRMGDFPMLRERADVWPWKHLQFAAYTRAWQYEYDTGLSRYRQRAERLAYIVDGISLTAIMHEEDRPYLVDRLAAQANAGLDDLAATIGSVDDRAWEQNTALGNAMYKLTLCLDILYEDIPTAQRLEIETKTWNLISGIAGWDPSPQAVRGLWYLYQGDDSNFQTERANYTDKVLELFTDSGVFYEGATYGTARFLPWDREQKATFMDVLEYQGYHDYYSNPTLQTAYECLTGSMPGASKYMMPFGDCNPLTQAYGGNRSAAFRLHRFSEKAARYHSWYMGDQDPSYMFLLYVVMDRRPDCVPEFAASRVYADGAAYFRDPEATSMSLTGGLWNSTIERFHSHKEVNAIALAGYGENLVRNAGYTLANEGALGWPYSWENSNANSGNTLLIDHTDHQGKSGAGIGESILARGFGYATANSGSALPNGQHQRSLLHVYAGSGASGYQVVFDEATPNDPTDTASTNFHPTSTNLTTVTLDTEFVAHLGGPQSTGAGDVYQTFFLATPPQSVEKRIGLLCCGTGSQSYEGQYLYSTYTPDADGVVRIATVLFPHDTAHPKADMARVAGLGWSGASVVQDSVVDLAIESDNSATVTLGTFSFRGTAGWRRSVAGEPVAGFVRRGTMLDIDTMRGIGIASDAPVSAAIDGATVWVASDAGAGAGVQVMYPQVSGVTSGGLTLSPVAAGAGWVRVALPPGNVELEIAISDGTPTPMPTPTATATPTSPPPTVIPTPRPNGPVPGWALH